MPRWSDDLLRTAAFMVAQFYLIFAILHVYWAMGGHCGLKAAVPQQDGKPVFKPGRSATLAVAIALGACAALLLIWLGAIPIDIPVPFLRIGLALIATAMLLRAIGDFRYVGLFKRLRGGQFGLMDTLLYTPLCILISAVLWLLVIVR